MSILIHPSEQKILFPPRPKGKISPSTVVRYERRGWVAQRKFNGTHVVINVSSDGRVGILTRHGEKPKQFTLTADHAKQILSLNLEKNQEYWLQGELLNNKTTDPRYKEKIVLFDVLAAGEYLFGGPTLVERVKLLDSICGHPTELEPHNGIALRVSENIWMAETFTSDFEKRYKEALKYDEIEGLVLKNPNSTIDNTGQKEYDVTWMVRCRKVHKNYSF